MFASAWLSVCGAAVGDFLELRRQDVEVAD